MDSLRCFSAPGTVAQAEGTHTLVRVPRAPPKRTAACDAAVAPPSARAENHLLLICAGVRRGGLQTLTEHLSHFLPETKRLFQNAEHRCGCPRLGGGREGAMGLTFESLASGACRRWYSAPVQGRVTLSLQVTVTLSPGGTTRAPCQNPPAALQACGLAAPPQTDRTCLSGRDGQGTSTLTPPRRVSGTRGSGFLQRLFL